MITWIQRARSGEELHEIIEELEQDGYSYYRNRRALHFCKMNPKDISEEKRGNFLLGFAKETLSHRFNAWERVERGTWKQMPLF